MPIISEIELDPVRSSGGQLISETDLDPPQLTLKKKAVNTPEEQLAQDPRRLEGPGQVDRPREYLTVGGEFTGGLGDIAEGLRGFANPERNIVSNLRQADLSVPGVLGAIIGGSPTLRTGLGVARAAFSPAAPLFNIATSAGKMVSDFLQQLGFTNAADVAGAGTSIAADVIGAPRVLSQLGKAAAKSKFRTLRSDRVTEARSGGARQEAALTEQAKGAAEQAASLREAQLSQLDEAKAATQRTVDDAALGNITQKKSIEAGGEIEKQTALAKAKQELADVAETEAEVRTLVQDAPTAEETGEAFRKTYLTKQTASKKRFNKEYDDILTDAKGIKIQGVATEEAARELLGEGVGILPSKADVTAGKLTKAVDVESEAYKNLKAQFSDPTTPESQKTIQALMKKSGIIQFDPKKEITLDQLIIDRQKIKGAIRALEDVGQDNIARQFKQLRAGIEDDLVGNPGITKRLAAVDKAYATEHAPFFSYGAPAREAAEEGVAGIVNRLIPKASDADRVEKLSALKILDDKAPVQKSWINQGVFEADKTGDFGKGLVSYWDKYSEPGDKVLKALLDDQYVHYKDIVTRLRTVKAKNINKTLDETLTEIEKRTGAGIKGIDEAQIKRMKSLQGLLEEGEKFKTTLFDRTLKKTEQITSDRERAIAKLRKDIDKEVLKITGKPISPDRIKNYGQMITIAGVGFSFAGAVQFGVPKIITGGLMTLYPEQIARMLENVRGTQLIRRAIRTVPGTSQAAANARQIQNYFRELDKENGKR